MYFLFLVLVFLFFFLFVFFVVVLFGLFMAAEENGMDNGRENLIPNTNASIVIYAFVTLYDNNNSFIHAHTGQVQKNYSMDIFCYYISDRVLHSRCIFFSSGFSVVNSVGADILATEIEKRKYF